MAIFRNLVVVAGLCLAFLSCKLKDPFYDEYAVEDLYRLPLIKPYELLNLYGADPNEEVTRSWALKFVYGECEGYSQLNISHIQVAKGVIYGHGKDGITSSPNYWFIVIPDQKIERIFKKRNDWIDFLKHKQLNPDTLYKVWPVFSRFKDGGILPWYNNN
jgi:hypothetical protein